MYKPLLLSLALSLFLAAGCNTTNKIAERPPLQAQQFPSNRIDDSAWNLYRNERYGFEIKYPTDFDGFHETSTDYWQAFETSTGVSGSKWINIVRRDEKIYHSDFSSFVAESCRSCTSTIPKQLAGQDGFLITHILFDYNSTSRKFIFKRGDAFYAIGIFYPTDAPDDFLEEMISTLKFIR